MQHSLFRKSINFIILILIINIIVVSTIGGNIQEIDNQFPKNPDNQPLNNDYILGYWKYDEGTGNIASDSSGHTFDGTIHGAEWIRGHAGDALNFDGVDDFIGLDNYSKNLGINKTDDVIFSVWFKTKSTQDSLIYSICDKWGISNPELSIQLCSNGSILFKIWTRYCGIAAYTENTYNNDDWHHLEIFFNGISAQPTVKMYVDNKLDGNITKYLCPIENNEFRKVKTGRRAFNATKHFNGLIDEFKIIKYPDGNEQNPPIISGPTYGDPGKEYEYTFVTEDPEKDDIWLYIDWGDGEIEKWIGPYNSSMEVTVSHEWSEEGRYEIKAKSKDIWDDSSWSDPYPVSIGNQPPGQPKISGPKSGEIGVEYEYTFVAKDIDGDDIYYYVDWGDGTFEDWFGPYVSNEEVSKTHTWNSKSVYEITAKAKDIHNNIGICSDPYLVSIGNQAPDPPEITGTQQGNTGVEYEYLFSIHDPDNDLMYLRVDWGSGTPGKWHGPFSSGAIVKLNYTWSEKGTYTIRAQTMDIFDKESKWGTLKVTIPKNRQPNNSELFRLPEMFSSIFEKLLSLQTLK